MSASERPVSLGRAYGPWSVGRQSVYLITAHQGTRVRVIYLCTRGYGEDVDPDLHPAPALPAVWRSTLDFQALMISTPTVRPSHPWPRRTPRVNLPTE